MAVPFDERMHCAIWNWIREFSNSPTTQYATNPSAILILDGIIECMSDSLVWEAAAAADVSDQHHSHLFLSPAGARMPVIGTFSEQMCTVAEHLHRTGQQQRLSWYDMKRTLQFYVSDAKEYIEHINSLGWNNHQLNSYFDLNLKDLNFPESPVSHNPIMLNQLLWSRYLTGTRIFHPTKNPQHSGEKFVIELLARGEDYWGPIISENIFRIQENFGEQECRCLSLAGVVLLTM
jgi:hypothetical protein